VTPNPEAHRCQLGIIFALPLEAHAFEQLITDSRIYHVADLTIATGCLDSQQVAWTVGGVGNAAAHRAAQLLCDGHDPRLLISAGFAGGLAPDLTRGQLVFPARVTVKATPSKPPIAVDPHIATELWKRHPPANRTLISLDCIAVNAAAKASLQQSTGADLVDMESWAVASVADGSGRDFLSVRVVSDTASESLPTEVTRLSQPMSPMRLFGTALGAIARRPRAAVDFWQLWERSLGQSQSLAEGLLATVAASTEQR